MVIMREYDCMTCGEHVRKANSTKYCSVKCHRESQNREFIAAWKNGTIDPERLYNGPDNALSKYIRNYLIETRYECWKCGWKEYHSVTKRIPLQVNHIDGNSQNCTEENLELLCPNCHSLTPTFGSLNKGNGRKNRRASIR